MKLYIANCSAQNHVLNYRLKESPKIWTQPVTAGSQVLIGSADLMSDQIDAIVEQLSQYGMVGVEDVKNSKRHIPLVYSVGKPVSGDIIRLAIFRNGGVLTERGVEARKAAAIATDKSLETFAQEAGLPAVDALSVSVEEVESGNMERTDQPIAEGIRIDKTGTAGGPPPRQMKKAKGGARRAA